MNILIVGSTSMIGKRIVERLVKYESNNIYTAGRNKINMDIYIDLENGDVEIPDNISVDTIIHCAAGFYGDDIEGCTKNEMINSIGAIRVAELAIELNCKNIIFLSTISTYDHVENEYYGSYGISKKHGSEYLQNICRNKGINYVALLCSQIYDEYGEAKKHQALFYYLLDKASRGENITIYGDLDVSRNYLFVEDLVDIVERIIDSEISGEMVCCYPQNYTISEIVNIGYNVFRKKGSIYFDSTKERMKKIYIPDEKKQLYDLINYYPQTDLFTGIGKIKDILY